MHGCMHARAFGTACATLLLLFLMQDILCDTLLHVTALQSPSENGIILALHVLSMRCAAWPCRADGLAPPPASVRGDLTFSHVRFAYPTRLGVTIFRCVCGRGGGCGGV